jgi:Amt family ammonium transporter
MASAVFLNTLVAGCLGMLGWIAVERLRDGRPTTFGAASGVIAGLVAITPSCGTANTLGAFIVGLAAGVVCSFAVGLKFRWGYDDSLDVVGVHFVEPSRRPTSFGHLGYVDAPGPRPEKAEDG